MAEKQFAYSGGKSDEFFADDDPLAELARIVGFEPRPAAPVMPAARQEPVLEPRPPEFALEDELLREFALYDAPHLDPVNEIALDETIPDGAGFATVDHNPPQDVYAPAVEPEGDVDPVEVPGGYYAELPIEDLLAAELSDSSFTKGEFVAETLPPAEIPVYGLAEEAAAADRQGYADDGFNTDEGGPSYEIRDLADELEQSIADTVSESAPAVQSDVTPEVPRFRLPLANFNIAAVRQPAVEPSAPAAEPVVSSANLVPAGERIIERAPDVDYNVNADWYADEFPGHAPVEPIASLQAVVADDVQTVAGAGAGASNHIDDLLAEVEQYSLPETSPAGSYRFELSPGPVAPAVVARPEASPEKELATDFAVEEVIDDSEFELDLDGIELELSDMSFDPPVDAAPAPKAEAPVSAPAASAPLSPAPAPAQVSWSSPAASASTVMGPGAAVSVHQPQVRPAYQNNSEVFARPAFASATAPAQPAAPLPFDPELIADPGDHLETLPELDVPALPVIEKEEPATFEPEYDLDIDAEMASLFEPTRSHEEASHAADAATGTATWMPTANAAAKSAQVSLDDFDEFERALEQDLRRTLKEPYDTDVDVAKMTLDPAIAGAARGRSRSFKGLLLASSLLVVGGAGAFGAYTWLFGDNAGSARSGPVVISADKDPVKVVPQDKGGKTVPNQDKAVYDRVAGASASDPKQEKLVTSDEEPIDVVQRTLIPDNLPLEGAEDDVGMEPTPTGETEDARLLPSDRSDEASSSNDNTPAGIAARKVRSMIVKPDGTIVARELPTEPVQQQRVVASTPALAAPTPKVEEPALVERVAEAAPAIEAETQPATAKVSAQKVATAAGEPAPVRSVKTSTVGDAAPLPETRPSAQPVAKAVAAAPAEEAVSETQPAPEPTQVASIAPGSYFVQVASLPSEAEAQKSYQNLSRKFGNVIGGRGVDIKRADIQGKGTYYRVRIPAGTKDEAVALCESYRAAGGNCLIAR